MTRWAPGVTEEHKRELMALARDRVRALLCVDIDEREVRCRRCSKVLMRLTGIERRGLPSTIGGAGTVAEFGDLLVIADHETTCRRRRGDA